eukprot:8501115-Alexandrium_andersonii.AAC.1
MFLCVLRCACACGHGCWGSATRGKRFGEAKVPGPDGPWSGPSGEPAPCNRSSNDAQPECLRLVSINVTALRPHFAGLLEDCASCASKNDGGLLHCLQEHAAPPGAAEAMARQAKAAG